MSHTRLHLALALIAAAVLVACGNKAEKAAKEGACWTPGNRIETHCWPAPPPPPIVSPGKPIPVFTMTDGAGCTAHCEKESICLEGLKRCAEDKRKGDTTRQLAETIKRQGEALSEMREALAVLRGTLARQDAALRKSQEALRNCTSALLECRDLVKKVGPGYTIMEYDFNEPKKEPKR